MQRDPLSRYIHITINTENKRKREILENNKRKYTHLTHTHTHTHTHRLLVRLTVDFSSETVAVRGSGMVYLFFFI